MQEACKLHTGEKITTDTDHRPQTAGSSPWYQTSRLSTAPDITISPVTCTIRLHHNLNSCRVNIYTQLIRYHNHHLDDKSLTEAAVYMCYKPTKTGSIEAQKSDTVCKFVAEYCRKIRSAKHNVSKPLRPY